mmetsp:Transcript_8189/g.14461  ORF Transcript_8189/g.14461 Transcript_8189/m.14461 type:complete len:258 (-) Transcript_8189:67-840(-)
MPPDSHRRRVILICSQSRKSPVDFEVRSGVLVQAQLEKGLPAIGVGLAHVPVQLDGLGAVLDGPVELPEPHPGLRPAAEHGGAGVGALRPPGRRHRPLQQRVAVRHHLGPLVQSAADLGAQGEGGLRLRPQRQHPLRVLQRRVPPEAGGVADGEVVVPPPAARVQQRGLVRRGHGQVPLRQRDVRLRLLQMGCLGSLVQANGYIGGLHGPLELAQRVPAAGQQHVPRHRVPVRAHHPLGGPQGLAVAPLLGQVLPHA